MHLTTSAKGSSTSSATISTRGTIASAAVRSCTLKTLAISTCSWAVISSPSAAAAAMSTSSGSRDWRWGVGRKSRKGEHVGRRVLAAPGAVQPLLLRVVGQGDVDMDKPGRRQDRDPRGRREGLFGGFPGQTLDVVTG